MSQKVKVSGTWRDASPYVKVGGSWKLANEVWNKVGGEWYTSFVKGGLVDRSWDGLDQTGEFGTGAGGTVYSIALQSDGKILVGGLFTSWNGTTVNYIVRLNSDVTHDTAFTTNTGTGANNTVFSLALQSDGKILIGGQFTTWNGTTVNRIVRLNSDGTRDTAFTTNTGTGANGTVRSIALQSDGKILVGGQFTSWNGTTVGRIVRLNSDGTRDTAFTTNTGTGANNHVFSIALQSDGKILVGGSFTTWNGTTVNYIVRLNSDGTRDTAFTTNTGTGANSTIFSLALQSDGKILVGGQFTTWNGTTGIGRIVRLNSNGTRDTAFTTNTVTGAGGTVYSIVLQSDGKIIVGGSFPTWNFITVNRIVRLNSDGTRDTAFTTNTGTGAGDIIWTIALQSDGKILVGGLFSTWNDTPIGRIVRLNADGANESLQYLANGTVYSIVLQSDGKILIGGTFTTWNGTTVNRIVRLNSDGTRDTAFTTNTGTGATSHVYSLALQSDGKILVGGLFSSWNGTTVNRIVRLNSDGTRDTAFTTNTGTGANGDVFSIALQSDGKILVGGFFTSWNGTTVGRIVRLNSDGTRDTAFTTNTGTGANNTNDTVRSIALQSDGKILVGGLFTTWNGTTVNRIVRLNSDGTRDTAFTTNTGTGAGDIIYSLALQSDGKILVGGLFTTWNGTTVNRIVRLNSDGTRDTAFTTNTGTGANSTVFSLALQSDGKILVGGAFTTWNGTTVGRIVRLNSDGTRDTAFTTNTGTGANGTVRSIALQSDGKILIGGTFTSFSRLDQFRRYFVRIGGEIAS